MMKHEGENLITEQEDIKDLLPQKKRTCELESFIQEQKRMTKTKYQIQTKKGKNTLI